MSKINLDPVHSLSEVRSAIDALDQKLVNLLATRLGYIHQATRFKTSVDQALVPARVEDVAQKVRTLAEEVGFDPERAERIWRMMMNECIAFEEEVLSKKGSNDNAV